MEMNHKSSLVRRAVLLSWLTISYNTVEGLVSVFFGIENESFALLGFGLDSFVEVLSAMLVLWRFKGEHSLGHGLELNRERTATFGIGILFVILGLGTIVASLIQLANRSRPDTTLPGLIVSVISLSFMFFLWNSKKNVAIGLDSSTMMKDSRCSLACIKLSGVLLAGSLLFIVSPAFWWADSLAAVVIGGLILKEGTETLQDTRKADFSGGCGCD